MTMEEAVDKATRLGLGGIAFTDHFDIDAPGDNAHFSFDPAEHQQKIDSLREKASIGIFKGIELGLQPTALESAKKAVALFEFDTIIASVHFVDGVDPYHGEYYGGRGEIAAYSRYLETIYECISNYTNFDILGHFDYIVRYSPYRDKCLSMKRYGDYLEPVLKQLAHNGQALEINTNTYRTRNGMTPVLDEAVYKRFRELGGEFVTLGSDAHETYRIAEGLSELPPMLYRCGFRYLTHFEKRTARCEKIELT